MISATGRSSAVLLLMAAHFASALDVGGAGLVILDLFPEHAGFLKGVSCLWGNAPGLAAPIVTGMLLDAGGCGAPPPEPGRGWGPRPPPRAQPPMAAPPPAATAAPPPPPDALQAMLCEPDDDSDAG